MVPRQFLPIAVALALFSLGAFAQSQDTIPELTPCTVSDDYLGQEVIVTGIIEFVDDTHETVTYADIEEFPCRMGIAFDRFLALLWPGGPPELNVGATVTARGILTLNTAPVRREIVHYVLELTEKPLVSGGGEPDPGPPENLCVYEAEVASTVSAEGTVLHFDESKAAGIYAELGTIEDCTAVIWVERDYWNQWSSEEQVRLTPGHPVRVTGLFTVVNGVDTIDIADPPVLLAKVIAPCEASAEDIDEMVLVEGTVGFIDRSDPEGVYFEMGTEDCYIGVWIASEDMAEWTPEESELLSLGTEVLAAGILRAFPDPMNPAGQELVIELAGALFATDTAP